MFNNYELRITNYGEMKEQSCQIVILEIGKKRLLPRNKFGQTVPRNDEPAPYALLPKAIWITTFMYFCVL